MAYTGYILGGFLLNLLITLASSVLPLSFGGMLLHFEKKGSVDAKILGKIFRFTECLCSLLLFLVLSFQLFPFSNVVAIAIAAFFICFPGYIPAKCKPGNSWNGVLKIELLSKL